MCVGITGNIDVSVLEADPSSDTDANTNHFEQVRE